MSYLTFKEPCTSCGGYPMYTGNLLCDAYSMGDSEKWDWIDVLLAGGDIEFKSPQQRAALIDIANTYLLLKEQMKKVNMTL